MEAAEPFGSGIGGRSALLEVAGHPVFVKRVPLTGLELRPEHVMSTANLFGLPLCYQYGIGSAGFGAWRELAAHHLTTRWVLDGAYPGFADEFGGLDGAVAHWEGSPAVRRRLEAVGRASSSLVLFLEHLPQTLGARLAGRADAPPPPWVEDGLIRGADFMGANGFVHFDAHPADVLTDGRELYFADLGLALADGFDRHVPAALAVAGFHHRLLTDGRRTPYPAAEVARALAV